ERTVGYYQPLAAGATGAFARSVPLLVEDLRVIRPTMLVSVPRLSERVSAAIQEKIGKSRLRKRLFALTVELGWRRFEAAEHRGPALSVGASTLFAVLDRLVARPGRARVCGRR